jgi:hypothetical protein
MRAAHGIAGGTGKVAAVGNLYYGKAAVLLVVLAKAAVVRAAIMRGGTKAQRHFGGLIVIADVFIIVDIRCYQYFLKAVVGAILKHIHLAVFKNDFGVYPAQAFGTKTQGKIIVRIIPFGHGSAV